MSEVPRRQPSSRTSSRKRIKAIPVTLGASQDVPMLYANKVLVNFIGQEFLVTVLAAFPDPWTGTPESPPPSKIEARVLARYAFSIPEWLAATKSFTDQIERLSSEGAINVSLVRTSA